MKQYAKKVISSQYHRLPESVLREILPRNIVVEPVAGCNSICSACPADQLKRPYGHMTRRTFTNVIEKIKPRNIGFYFMGEPFLNPDLFNMIAYAKENKARTSLNTNGSLVYQYVDQIIHSGLDKIVISLDGITQKTSSEYRKGLDVETVKAGIKALAAKAQDTSLKIEVRTLVFRNTLRELPKIRKFLEENGVTNFQMIRPILTGWGGKENPDLDTLGYLGRVKKGKPEVCPSLFRMAITWEGDLLPCCNDVHGSQVFGNINEPLDYEALMFRGGFLKKKAERAYEICEICFDA